MLLVWQAYQHSCSVASKITIKTHPMPVGSTRNHYINGIYRFTSCSGSFLALFSLFSFRFCPFCRFERLDSVTAALGRGSAHCSATCAVIGRRAVSRSRPLAGVFDWWHNRPIVLCLCVLLTRKKPTSRNNELTVSSGMTYLIRLMSHIHHVLPISSMFWAHYVTNRRKTRRKPSEICSNRAFRHKYRIFIHK